MKRIFLFIILIMSVVNISADEVNIDSIIQIVKSDISHDLYKKAWRCLHYNRFKICEKNETDYNILLSDIYRGAYTLLEDDTLKRENKETLVKLADSFLSDEYDRMEAAYGSMWERMFWLSRIYYQNKDSFFSNFVCKCREIYQKSKYKNDPYYFSLVGTYINYAIKNNMDWSYVLSTVPISELRGDSTSSDLALAVAYHQYGIAHLHKEISNRVYDRQNPSHSFKSVRGLMVDMGKAYLDKADKLYNKCDSAQIALLLNQLNSDYKLYKWLKKYPKKVDMKGAEEFSSAVCLYNVLPMDYYSPVSEQLDSLCGENLRFLKRSMQNIADAKYREAADSLTEIAPSLIMPVSLILYYHNIIYGYTMCDSLKANYYLKQFYDISTGYIIPYIFKNSTEYKRQQICNLLFSTLKQLGMKLTLRYHSPESSVVAYNIFQTIKNFETEFNAYIRYAKNNVMLDELTSQSLKNYEEKRDSLYYGDVNDEYFAGEVELLELNKMILNGRIPINKVLDRIHGYYYISQKLDNKATIVEYCVYAPMEGGERYAAFVINTDKKSPYVVDICSVEEASELVSKDISTINNVYSNENLYSVFMSKIVPYFMHDTLVICPVGVLESVNFDAIYHKGHRLMDKYCVFRAYSGHSFIKGARTHHHGGMNAVLYGGIAYSEDQKKVADETSNHYKLTRGVYTERGSLPYLQYSAEEVGVIRDILNANDYNANILSGLDATEASFLSLDGKAPSILHIATHGFFISDNEDLNKHSFFNNIDLYRDNKLLHSGLFMSSSSGKWDGLKPQLSNNDGILSAYEISKLDLSNVNLAVLSACETAEGYIDNIESTQGLQYAFRQAGAGSMLLSLWKIYDSVTYKFMKEFYSSFFKEKNIQKAYKSALKKIKAEYAEPYYWAGFILIYN